MSIELLEKEEIRKRKWIILKYLLRRRFYKTKVLLLLKKNCERTHRIWTKPRTTLWWDSIVKEHFTVSDWIENFRMSKEVFIEICNLLRTDLAPKQNTISLREPLSVEKQIAICIYKFASCAEYRVIANNFGVSKH